MPLHLRSARAEDGNDVPVHYERVGLRPAVRRLGWALGSLALAGGISVMIAGQGTWLEVAGAALGSVGAVAAYGLIRCGHFELTLGRRWLVAATGPLRQRVAPEAVEGWVESRTATGWRRLFAEHEEVVPLPTHGASLVVPTRAPGALLAALSGGEARAVPARGDRRSVHSGPRGEVGDDL